ncbi:MAG TPA: hypothetical protein VK338_05960 [Candidatus Nitrosocosmicus sp.]|nr:hypothetical protein [Candidatus Nitrosocosmicus sp.]
MIDGSSSPDISNEARELEARLTQQWQQLDNEAQEVILYLTYSDPSMGVDEEYLEVMNLSKEAIDKLIQAGLIEMKTRTEIAQQFVEEHKAEVEAIRNRERDRWERDPKSVYTFSDEERQLLSIYDSEVSVMDNNSEGIQYILNDEMRKFVINNLIGDNKS